MLIAKRFHYLGKCNPSVLGSVRGYCNPVIPENKFHDHDEAVKTTVRKNRKSSELVKPLKKISSGLHAERAFNKHLFGPLHETKQKKNKRLTQNESESHVKYKKWNSYNKSDYERFAATYSFFDDVSGANAKLPLNGQQSNPVKDLNSSDESSYICDGSKPGMQATDSDVPGYAVNDLVPENVNSETNQRSTSRVLNGTEEGLQKEEKFLKVYNPNYMDAPCSIDIHSCLTFPLFHNTKSSLISSSILENTHLNSESASVINGCDGSTHNPLHKVPSVSHILSSTMSDASKAALAKWEKQMTEELGVEGFQVHKQELFSRGTLLHRCIHTQLENHTPPSAEEQEQLKGLWTSIRNVVLEVEAGEVDALESSVTHPHLHYGGIIDCVALYRGTPVVIEWKTSSKVKRTLRSTYDNPLQLAAYLGAMQFDPAFQRCRKVQAGLIVLSYNSGEIGDTHLLTSAQLKYYWRQWLQRLAKFWTQQRIE